MKTKITFSLLLLAVSILSFGQDSITARELRKTVLKSDVILASQSYKTTKSYANDYSIEQFYTMNKIDTLIKNVTQFKIADKIRIQQQIDDYSAFWSEDVISAVPLDNVMNIDVRYTDLLFLKKENKQYKLLGIVKTIEWDDLIKRYIPAINQIMQIEKIIDYNERYTKTIDWFIENNGYPDEDFFAFYAEKNIPKDGIFLTAEQQQRAKENFLKGSGELRPFMDKETVRIYMLKKLKEIRNSKGKHYWHFYYELSELYKFKYKSTDYILQQLLNDDCMSNDNKEMIMDYFIKKLEEEIKAEK